MSIAQRGLSCSSVTGGLSVNAVKVCSAPRLQLLLFLISVQAAACRVHPELPQMFGSFTACHPICALDKWAAFERTQRGCSEKPERCPVRCICYPAGTIVRCPKKASNLVKASQRGGWAISSSYLYLVDVPLAKAIAELVGRESSLVELGAGTGCYQAALHVAGMRQTNGYDYSANGTYNTLVAYADLSTPQRLAVAARQRA